MIKWISVDLGVSSISTGSIVQCASQVFIAVKQQHHHSPSWITTICSYCYMWISSGSSTSEYDLSRRQHNSCKWRKTLRWQSRTYIKSTLRREGHYGVSRICGGWKFKVSFNWSKDDEEPIQQWTLRNETYDSHDSEKQSSVWESWRWVLEVPRKSLK